MLEKAINCEQALHLLEKAEHALREAQQAKTKAEYRLVELLVIHRHVHLLKPNMGRIRTDSRNGYLGD